MSKKKKIKRREGDIFQIKLNDASYGFGRVLRDPLCAFYDLKMDDIPFVEEIVKSPVLFKVWVMNHAIWYGRWKVIGNIPLDETLLEEPFFAKIDPISGNSYIYHVNREVPANREQLRGLERAAIWEPEHIERRLCDYFEGKPNHWVEKFKIN